MGVSRIWADALCINQQDRQEKSVQIRNMRHIYSKADEAYAWVGRQDNDKAADAIFFLEMLLLEKCDEMLADASNGTTSPLSEPTDHI